MRRLTGSLSVLVGAVLAVGAVRCASFAEMGEPPGPADAAEAGDATRTFDGAAADAGSEGSARTGVACGAAGRCAVGESCCGDGSHAAFCAVDCVAADASFYVFECGRTSDCPPGDDCCGYQNGTPLCDGRLAASRCLPAGNCRFCGADAGGSSPHLCDSKSNDECPGHRCNLGFDQSIYTACSL